MNYPDTICQLCFPDMRYVANVSDELVLGYEHGGYCLLIEPCHNGDILVRFIDAPKSDPAPDDDDEADAWFENTPGARVLSDGWILKARAEMKPILGGSLRGAWSLVEDLRANGYDVDEHGDAELWLYNRIGQLVEKDARGGVTT